MIEKINAFALRHDIRIVQILTVFNVVVYLCGWLYSD